MSSIVFRTLTLMSVLLCGVSADQVVSLHCDQTVNVTYGDDLPLRCDIEFKQDNCNNVSVGWNDSAGNLCINNTCTSDYKTFTTLQMPKVTENKTIFVKISADCGMDSETIKVKVNPSVHPPIDKPTADVWAFPTTTPTIEPPQKDKIIAISVAAVSAVIIVAAGVLFLYKRNKKPPVCPTEESATLNSDSSYEK